jgi:tRNA threonylcarbamoyladenosine biosynthesis protein TsaB
MNREKNLLAVDTSSRVLSVAIRSDARGVFETNLEGAPRHSEQLIEAIHEGMKKLKLKKNDLNEFIWGLGPGSFTGLRIGLSVLKAFELGFQKKSFGASSLDLIAVGCGFSSGSVAACVDARRDRIYAATYEFEAGNVRRVHPESVLSLDEFCDRIDKKTILAGDALVKYGDAIRKKLGKQAVFLSPEFWYPRAISLFQLRDKKQQWLSPLTLRKMVPRYLHRSEAEDKRNGQS